MATELISLLDQSIAAVRESDTTLRELSASAAKLRDWPYLDWLGLGAFIAYARREIIQAPKLYALLFSERPLKAYRKGGIKDEHIEHVRTSIYFYLLFLFYQAVQYPLTLGPRNLVEAAADLTIQSMLLVAILRPVWKVQAALNKRHADEEKRKSIQDWLEQSLDKMGIKLTSLAWKALVIFLTAASLVLVQVAPAVASGLVAILEALRDLSA